MQDNKAICQKLNFFLADLNVFYAKLHNFQWNIVGIGFFEISKKLEELSVQTSKEMTHIAERILILQERPLGTLKEYLEVTSLKEISSSPIKTNEIAKEIKKDFQSLLDQVCRILEESEKIQDNQTTHLLQHLSLKYEKNIWMLSAYLEYN